MKEIIRQWLCQHKDTTWVSTKSIRIKSVLNLEGRLESVETIVMCNDCGKFKKYKA